MLFFCTSMSLILIACTKDDVGININNNIQETENESGNNTNNNSNPDNPGTTPTDTTTTKTTADIYFEADVLSMVTRTNSSDPIQTDRFLDIYVYTGGNFTKTYPYQSSSLGVLSSLTGSPMSLATGSYVFYTPAVNTKNIRVPAFTNGTATSLSNKTDYVWSTKLLAVTGGTDQQVDLSLSHSCVQIVVQVLSNNVTLNTNVTPSISITPSTVNSSSTWDLTTGVITPSTSISTATDMGVTLSTSSDTLFMGQVIMLPLIYSDDLTANFAIMMEGESTTRQYTAQLPVYTNTDNVKAFRAGYSYIYKLELTSQGITFSDVTIINWIDINATGQPIVPSQVGG